VSLRRESPSEFRTQLRAAASPDEGVGSRLLPRGILSYAYFASVDGKNPHAG
jgi:hypothetical protein